MTTTNKIDCRFQAQGKKDETKRFRKIATKRTSALPTLTTEYEISVKVCNYNKTNKNKLIDRTCGDTTTFQHHCN